VPQFFTSIAQPEVQAQTITYPPSLIQMTQNNLFHGLSNEDPYAQLATYIEICNTIRLAGVHADAIKLSLFSFSSILQVVGCTIYGGAHESGCCIPNQEKIAHEVNYIGNQPIGNFNTSGFPRFQNNQ